MREFHLNQTFWIRIEKLSKRRFSSIALWPAWRKSPISAAIRQDNYIENDETELVNRIYKRADRHAKRIVGVRRFANDACQCAIRRGRRIQLSSDYP
ncbi:MAG: hypothetical protein OXC26_21185 [Albidovulum sp.]|nr:hypothetical protein [Albidovulum sp.]